MYKILRNIMMNQEREFCVFLFSQKEQYLNVLLARLFQDIGRSCPKENKEKESPTHSTERGSVVGNSLVEPSPKSTRKLSA